MVGSGVTYDVACIIFRLLDYLVFPFPHASPKYVSKTKQRRTAALAQGKSTRHRLVLVFRHSRAFSSFFAVFRRFFVVFRCGPPAACSTNFTRLSVRLAICEKGRLYCELCGVDKGCCVKYCSTTMIGYLLC